MLLDGSVSLNTGLSILYVWFGLLFLPHINAIMIDDWTVAQAIFTGTADSPYFASVQDDSILSTQRVFKHHIG